jgi:hypothetical protein
MRGNLGLCVSSRLSESLKMTRSLMLESEGDFGRARSLNQEMQLFGQYSYFWKAASCIFGHDFSLHEIIGIM